MDVLKAVKNAIAEKIASDPACLRAAQFDELRRTLCQAADIGMRVTIFVYTYAYGPHRHWRVSLNESRGVVAQEMVAQQEQIVFGEPGAYSPYWAGTFLSFVDDLFDDKSRIEVKIETAGERIDRERMSY